jgi:hypothetical protein
MTDLILARVQLDTECTIGELTIAGHHICWTCEDPVREVDGQPVAAWKIKGQTAIPYGRYPVRLTFSRRFQVETPQLIDVPGFEGIRIHPGNDADDTEGCILPGFERRANGVGDSRRAYAEVLRWLQAIWRQDLEAWIDIRRAEQVQQVADSAARVGMA